MIYDRDGATWVSAKFYPEGRLSIWARCDPAHAQVLERVLRNSVTARPHIMEEKFYTLLTQAGVPREVGEALLADLREEDVILLRPVG
jgi:hypothetical protein